MIPADTGYVEANYGTSDGQTAITGWGCKHITLQGRSNYLQGVWFVHRTDS